MLPDATSNVLLIGRNKKNPISQHYLPIFIYKARFSFLVTTDFEETELK